MDSGIQYIRGFHLKASTAALNNFEGMAALNNFEGMAALNNFEGMAALLGSSFRVDSMPPSALYVYIIEFIILYVVKFC